MAEGQQPHLTRTSGGDGEGGGSAAVRAHTNRPSHANTTSITHLNRVAQTVRRLLALRRITGNIVISAVPVVVAFCMMHVPCGPLPIRLPVPGHSHETACTASTLIIVRRMASSSRSCFSVAAPPAKCLSRRQRLVTPSGVSLATS